jgi:hypothetical protein
MLLTGALRRGRGCGDHGGHGGNGGGVGGADNGGDKPLTLNPHPEPQTLNPKL